MKHWKTEQFVAQNQRLSLRTVELHEKFTKCAKADGIIEDDDEE